MFVFVAINKKKIYKSFTRYYDEIVLTLVKNLLSRRGIKTSLSTRNVDVTNPEWQLTVKGPNLSVETQTAMEIRQTTAVKDFLARDISVIPRPPMRLLVRLRPQMGVNIKEAFLVNMQAKIQTCLPSSAQCI